MIFIFPITQQTPREGRHHHSVSIIIPMLKDNVSSRNHWCRYAVLTPITTIFFKEANTKEDKLNWCDVKGFIILVLTRVMNWNPILTGSHFNKCVFFSIDICPHCRSSSWLMSHSTGYFFFVILVSCSRNCLGQSGDYLTRDFLFSHISVSFSPGRTCLIQNCWSINFCGETTDATSWNEFLFWEQVKQKIN
jgi:hypothetical protein